MANLKLKLTWKWAELYVFDLTYYRNTNLKIEYFSFNFETSGRTLIIRRNTLNYLDSKSAA